MKTAIIAILVLILILHFCQLNCELEIDDFDSYFVSSPLELTDQNFTETLSTTNSLVFFFWYSVGLPDEIFNTAYLLSEIFNEGNNTNLKVASVDCDENNQTCIDNGIIAVNDAVPYVIKLFKINKVEGISYNDADKPIHYFYEFIKEHIDLSASNNSDSKTVVELTDQNFEELTSNGTWIVNFYYPWCIHAKNLNLIWNKLPSVLDQNTSVSVGSVDCEKYALGICMKYYIFNSPTILWLENGNKTERYTSNLTVKILKSYIESKVELKNED